jgi:SnoaL-like protein
MTTSTTTQLSQEPAAHPDHGWVAAMFRAVDEQDIEGNARYMDPQVRFRFGNGDVMHGHAALAEGQRHLYASIRAMRHRLIGLWREGDVVTVEADVTYTRLDGAEVTVPVLSLLRLSGPELVGDYRVFFDLGPVFAPY